MWRKFICLPWSRLSLQNTRLPDILMSDATYIRFVSLGPHPWFWHQMRAWHKWAVMEKLGCLSEHICLFTPTFHLCSLPNLPGWLIRAPLLFCLQQHAVKVSHANLYAPFHWGCELWKTYSKHRYQIIIIQIQLEMMNWMTHCNSSLWSLSETWLRFIWSN